ncbi:Fis family transcriptional regulator [Marinomonas sp. C2222]|uniref:Fis family transcriptional regulator n=1 Tax=Marinomonas sargassi TaxID=2984494 RepID=A0ABT2YRB7_9GAMM|nr:Fis family transcriptional regulator [Marinomonas sargassi]MCV2402430.1 Fis family transcriptional regulator [Marinomonas sargassi]
MKKTDKKIEKALRESLTNVCDLALENVSGFLWLTHLVNFNSYPSSLKIICVFETDIMLSNAMDNNQHELFCRWISDELSKANLIVKSLSKHISFDTEEACQRSHNGKWDERLSRL